MKGDTLEGNPNSRAALVVTASLAGPLGAFGMMAFLAGALQIFGEGRRAFWMALIGGSMGILVYGFIGLTASRHFRVPEPRRARLSAGGAALCISLATWVGARLLDLQLLALASATGLLLSFCLFGLLLAWFIIKGSREGGMGQLR